MSKTSLQWIAFRLAELCYAPYELRLQKYTTPLPQVVKRLLFTKNYNSLDYFVKYASYIAAMPLLDTHLRSANCTAYTSNAFYL